MALAAMMEEVDRYCVDEKLTVTYQWLSRKLDVASDVSKRCVPPAAPRPPSAGARAESCRARRQAPCRSSVRTPCVRSLLAQYATTKGDKVNPLFFVSGRAKGGDGTHSIKIVSATDVDGAARGTPLERLASSSTPYPVYCASPQQPRLASSRSRRCTSTASSSRSRPTPPTCSRWTMPRRRPSSSSLPASPTLSATIGAAREPCAALVAPRATRVVALS